MDIELAWWHPYEGRKLSALSTHELLCLKAGLELGLKNGPEGKEVLKAVEEIAGNRGQ